MAYDQRTDWKDDVSGGTPIMAADLIRIEQGIAEAVPSYDLDASITAQINNVSSQTTGALASYKNRANHTGTQAASTITGLATVAISGQYSDLAGRPALATVATTGNYSDLAGKPTIPAAYTDEQVRDVIGATLVSDTPSTLTITVDDAGDAIHFSGLNPTLANLPSGSIFYVMQNGDGSWPNRLSSRTDLLARWIRIVAASADPGLATSPAVNGAYLGDIVEGA